MRKSAIRCSICGKATPPGALLCAPCRAALKRAGHLSVQDLPHYLAPVRRHGAKSRHSAEARRPASVAPAQAPAAAAPTAARRVLLAAAALGVLAGVAYLGQPQPVSPRDAPQAGTLAGSASSAAALRTTATPAGASPASIATASAPPTSSPPPRADEPARPIAARVSPRTKQAALRAEVVVAPSSPPVAESVAPAPPPQVPLPNPRETPPPPDRWQQMSDALARCDREGGFSGFICDQRVRLDSCEGYWGKVPQCPNPPENPR
jgi:hypothetical protein